MTVTIETVGSCVSITRGHGSLTSAAADQGATSERSTATRLHSLSYQLYYCLYCSVENFQLHLMNREQKFSLLSEQEENRVDKELVKNLFIGYLTAVPHKKNEVLKLITSILEFSPIELEQVIVIHTHTHIQTHTHTDTHTYIQTHTHKHRHTYTHTYIDTHTHTHTHTHN